MKLKDLLTIGIHEVDVYENVADLIGIAFSWDNSMELTEEGKKHFELALNYEVKGITGNYLIMDTEKTLSKEEIKKYSFEDDDMPEATQNVIDFFWSYAGYCSIEEYDLWFISKEDLKK